MNNTTAVPATTAARLVAIKRVMRRSASGLPVFPTTGLNDPTGRWALPTTYSVQAAAGLVCSYCDQPANGRPALNVLHALGIGPIWHHRDCDEQLLAEQRAATVRLCATYGFRVPEWAVTP